MSEKLSNWFKENCKDRGHVYYGEIMRLLKAQPGMDFEPKASPSVHDEAKYVEEKARELNNLILRFIDSRKTMKHDEGVKEIRDFIATIVKDCKPKVSRAKVVCLCGSTRFTELMLIHQWELTKQGFVVLSWCALPDSYFKGEDRHHIGDQEGVKEIVDEVHFRKIDLADEVFILNVDGYIGESTRNELNYAKKTGKAIRFLEPDKAGIEVED